MTERVRQSQSKRDWKDAIPLVRKGKGNQATATSCASCGGCSCNTSSEQLSKIHSVSPVK